MKNINLYKKIMVIIIVFFVFCLVMPVSKAGQTTIKKVNGGNLTYSDGKPVTINTEYIYKNEMRAVWVSALTGDIAGYTSPEQYKDQMISVLETLEYYNMNTIIFHVRMMNDAFYESNYNSYSSYYNVNADWDPLSWLIDECHKRGIEFHAWMNPYRVTTNVSKSLEDIAKGFKGNNAASNPKNLLKGTSSVILNPGMPQVKSFLVNTCMELAENYDIDAIHFDDYFYASGIDDTETRLQYNTTGLSTDDWRRQQVNDFIQSLHNKLLALNKSTGRCVQLGIAPTGVYRNGNGVVTYDSNGTAITTGSATRGQQHYAGYLYADTVKWVNEGWIDYILPQTYWALEHGACPFADLITWWDKVVKNKKTNLYASLGLYMKTQGGSGSWSSSSLEAFNQTMLVNSLENVRGTSVYNYLALLSTVNSKDSFKNMDELWSKPAILPVIRTQEFVKLGKVNDLKIESNANGYKLSWEQLDNAKFYVVYRSENPITYANSEVYDIIGNVLNNGRVEFTDINYENGKEYYYAVKPQAYCNALGDGEIVDTDAMTSGDLQSLGSFDTFVVSDNLVKGQTITVRFSKLIFPFGDKPKYELTYSFGDGSEKKITDFYLSRVQNCCDITIPEDAKEITIKLKGYNNIGETVEVISKPLVGHLGTITNFSVVGDLYADNKTKFIWNAVQEEGVTYELQYSSNSYTWETVGTVDGKVSFNNTMEVETPKVTGEVYFRIVGNKDGRYAFSNVLKSYMKYYLGEIKFLTVNDENLKDYYITKENDRIVVKWRKQTMNGEAAVYSVMCTVDGLNWQNIRVYDSQVQSQDDGQFMTISFKCNYSSAKLYIKINATCGNYEVESDKFIIYIGLEDLFFEEFIDQMNKDVKTSIIDLDIYK